MKDKNTSMAGYAQASVAVLSAFGILVSPETVSEISAGAIALFGVLSAVKGHFTKDK